MFLFARPEGPRGPGRGPGGGGPGGPGDGGSEALHSNHFAVASNAAAAAGVSLTTSVAELEQTLALEKTRLQGEARALFDRLQETTAAAQAEKEP